MGGPGSSSGPWKTWNLGSCTSMWTWLQTWQVMEVLWRQMFCARMTGRSWASAWQKVLVFSSRFSWKIVLLRLWEVGVGMKDERKWWRMTWVITMVIVSPLSGVVGPLPNGRFMAYTWGCSKPLTNWDDPPSIAPPKKVLHTILVVAWSKISAQARRILSSFKKVLSCSRTRLTFPQEKKRAEPLSFFSNVTASNAFLWKE